LQESKHHKSPIRHCYSGTYLSKKKGGKKKKKDDLTKTPSADKEKQEKGFHWSLTRTWGLERFWEEDTSGSPNQGLRQNIGTLGNARGLRSRKTDIQVYETAQDRSNSDEKGAEETEGRANSISEAYPAGSKKNQKT